jgi:beta-lactamase class A
MIISNRLFLVGLAAMLAAPFASSASLPASAGWAASLQQALTRLDDAYPGELGVYVHDLDSGQSVSWRGDETWYLASGIKVVVAIAALRDVEAGPLTLDDTIVLRDSDYVDGAGPTNHRPPGSALRIGDLLELMLIHSDNTATDLVIRQLGIERVNAVAEELMPGHARITSLADVRRHAYSGFHPRAFELGAQHLLALRQVQGEARVDLLARQLGVPRSELALESLDAAFDAYYATGLNGAPLSAFGQLLAALQDGRALGAEGTATLLDILGRVATGERRIKAGLPAGSRFAHKTGTQHRRTCDLGVASHNGRRLVVAACTRGEHALAGNERVLREVGAALVASGAFEVVDEVRTAP